MYLGKNIKVASILEYNGKDLIFVKNNIVDKNDFPIFNDEWYPILENKTREEAESIVQSLQVNKFYMISENDYKLVTEPHFISLKNKLVRINTLHYQSNNGYKLDFVPYLLYTKRQILKKLQDTNLELDFVKTKKRKER